jgi:hypothetical protein
MDAVDILKICFRRWYVMLPILLGAAGVSYQLVQSQETTYTAFTSYGLVQPRLTADAGALERNPLGTDDSRLVGAALEAQLNSRLTQEQLGSEATQGWGPGESSDGSSYSVEIPQFETTYEVRAWGTDQKAVQEVVDRVIEAAPRIADELQTRAGAPESVRYEPFVLAPTQVAALASTSAMKVGIAVMGVGTLVGAAWSVVVDRMLRRRRRTNGGTADSQYDPVAGPAPSATSDEPASGPYIDPPARVDPPAKGSKGTGTPESGRRGPTDKPGKGGAETPPPGGRPDRRHQPLVRR